MHPRNKYKHKKPDFVELAKRRPALQPFLIFKGPDYATINFQDPCALRELACALLECDFNLKLEIPLDRLIPTIPLRLNYVHWIEDLLMTDDGSVLSGNEIHGIDIGTGASCVYPLLGARLNGWRFTASEIDAMSVECAVKNVHENSFDASISVLQVGSDVILEGMVDDDTSYDFCMCNPPFYQDIVEREGDGSYRTGACPSPLNSSASRMADHETITEGGEVQFVSRILMDSLKLRTRIRWYSSMLGKKSSIKELLKQLKHHQVPVITTTEFVQGRTHRWGIAWSYCESEKSKANDGVSRGGNKKETVYTMKLPDTFTSCDVVQEWITQQFNTLQVDWSLMTGEDGDRCLTCKAVKKMWANQRRKRRLAAAQHQETASKRPKESTEYSQDKDNGERKKDSPQVVPQELPIQSCDFEFTCTLNRTGVNLVQFKWLRGDNKDNLHQIIQYLKNQAAQSNNILIRANGKKQADTN